MGRILLAVEGVELAVDLVNVLEEEGHLAEHLFDLTEAILRAEITRPDVLVVEVARVRSEHLVLRRFAASQPTPVVILSASAAAERLARQIGAAFVRAPEPEPANALAAASSVEHVRWTASLLDVVQTAIDAARGAISAPRVVRKRSGTVAAAPAVLIAVPSASAGAIVASFVKTQLGLRCELVGDPIAAGARLSEDAEGPPIRAVLLDRAILRDPLGGPELLLQLKLSKVPIIPLRIEGDDETAAGRAAWDAVPALRTVMAKLRSNAAGHGDER